MASTEESSPVPGKPRAVLPTIELLSRARRIIHGDLYTVLGAGVVVTLLLIVAFTTSLIIVMNYLVAQLEWTYHRDYQNALLTLISLPLVAYVTTGVLQFFIQLARGSKPGAAVLLRYHSGYIHMLLYWLLYYLLYFFLVKVALRGVFDPARYEFEILVRMSAGLLFFAWVFVRLIFVPLFIVDGNSNIRQAARRSWMLTSGRTRRTAWLCLFFLTVGASGALLAGIGLLYSLGIMLTAYVLIFDALSHPEMPGNS